MRQAKTHLIDIGEVELSVLEWPGDGDPVLLLHATGFHSRCWSQVVEHLPGEHIYAADLRFHGGSGAVGDVNWQLLVEDTRLLIEHLDLNGLVGVGHSIGGYLMARGGGRPAGAVQAIGFAGPGDHVAGTVRRHAPVRRTQ